MKNSAFDKSGPLRRLARIRGQVDGISRMLDEDRDCVDVLIQLRAVHAAVRKVEEQLLHAHARRCVAAARQADDAATERRHLDALFDVLSRYAGR